MKWLGSGGKELGQLQVFWLESCGFGDKAG